MASKQPEVLDPAAEVATIKRLASRRALNRRNFMAALGAAGAAGTALVSSKRTPRPSVVEAAGPTQADVLNFALNLEYLEATFYSFITQGTDLPTTLTAGSGTVYNQLAKVTFPTQQITDLMNELYFDELSHVKALLSVLGPLAVARPTLDLLGTNNAKTATATITAPNAISYARLFEDVGVTAYAGAATMLSGAYLTSAAQILAVEGFHSGALRLVEIQNSTVPYTPAGYFEFFGVLTKGSTTVTNISSVTGIAVGQVLTGTGIASGTKVTAVSAADSTITLSTAATASTSANSVTLIVTTSPGDPMDVKPADPGSASAAASGPSLVAGSSPAIYQGFFATAGTANSNSTTPAGVAFARTTSQVLSVVYSNAGAAPNPGVAGGGFFPGGFTGIIKTI